jgi:CBS domain-containing protein
MFDFDVLKVSVAGEQDEREADKRRVVALNTVHMDGPVTDVPRRPSLTLAPEAAVATAIDAMRKRRTGAAIVVKNHRPVGVITDRDILGQACAEVEDLWSVPVGAIMSPCLQSLRDTDTVATALRTMCARRQWHLPIVCGRGLFLGALDIEDVSLWLRDRLTLLSIDAALSQLS